MSFPRYPRYKASGVEWLGDVPADWPIKRVGFLFDERRVKVSDKDFAALSVTKSGIVPQLETAAKTDDGDNRKLVRAGDFVINSRSDRKGSAGVSKLDGCVSLINTVLAPRPEVSGAFIHHLCRSAAFQEEFYRNGKGIVADLWSTNFSDMKDIVLPVPSIVEQQAIAAFLDRETAKIDALVAEQVHLIGLLKEKRQAVISHAVTKGLNPNAPMKDSGIEWLGQVPAHWGVVPFRSAIWFQEGPGIMASDFHDRGVPLLRVSGVGGRWATLEGCNYLDPGKVEARWAHFRAQVGDLLISASASMGTVCEVGEEAKGAVPYTGLIRLVPATPSITKDFIRAFVVSSLFSAQIDVLKAGATIQHFGPTHLRELKLALPPREEQQRITSWIQERCAEIDQLLAEAERSSVLLLERRASLISAAVTGQIDVRPESMRTAA